MSRLLKKKPKQPRRPRGRRVLLVDDNPFFRACFSGFLTSANYRVDEARSAEEGLKKLRRIKPDLIILDLMKPGAGGPAFLREISDQSGLPRWPVLILTARSDVETFYESFGADGYLFKSCTGDELLAKVRDVLVKSAERHGVAVSPAAGRRVLLIEDDERVVEHLRQALARCGCRLRDAATPGEALETAPRFKPHAIVANQVLPGMNGDVVVSRLRKLAGLTHVPAIVYDQSRSDADRHRQWHKVPDGVQRFLTTAEAPVIVEALEQVLRRVDRASR